MYLLWACIWLGTFLFPSQQVSITALLLLLGLILFYLSPDLVLPIHFLIHRMHVGTGDPVV
jgi:hypothetical protein